jgi:hypothetical protein
VADHSARHGETRLAKVPLVIPRRKAFALVAADRIILPTLMLILPDLPPGTARHL